jgi:hypothetical protein
VRGCHIRDSFARGILLQNVSDAFAASVLDPASGNDVLRCPIYRPSVKHDDASGLRQWVLGWVPAATVLLLPACC